MKNCSYMSYKCEKIIEIIFSNFNVSNATNISYMFYYCSKLSTLPDISKWNTKNVTNMYEMFSECSNNLVIPYKFRNK